MKAKISQAENFIIYSPVLFFIIFQISNTHIELTTFNYVDENNLMNVTCYKVSQILCKLLKLIKAGSQVLKDGVT